jgi:hypothetical protein
MKKTLLAVLFPLALAVAAPVICMAQTSSQPRQLSEADHARIRASMDREKQRQELARQQALLHQEEERRRAEEAAIAQAEWEAQQTPVAQPSFAELLAHGAGVFQDEMAKKNAEQAAMQANLARIRMQAEAVERDRERERQRQQREREAQERQRQLAQQSPLAQAGGATQETAAQLRERQLRENVAAERQRMAAQQQQAGKAEADGQAAARAQAQVRQQAEQQRIAAQNASEERQRKAEADRLQALRQAEQNLRSGFSGRATTCAGGGKDVLYLQTSRPSKTGCNVGFEARCPGTPSGSGVYFSQGNYIGGSCMGIGDNIRIGTMNCAAEQVQISMTRADCGSGG